MLGDTIIGRLLQIGTWEVMADEEALMNARRQ
jgi:hypothetical protein